MRRRCVILCPLEIERRAAASAASGRAFLVRTGPGAGAMRAALEKLISEEDRRDDLLILFGVAGGLAPVDGAIAGRVIDAATGATYISPVCGEDGLTIAGVNEPALSIDDKRRVRERTGAAMVDMESHAFAQLCDAHHLRWIVIRGVSDGPDEALPLQSPGWVHANGSTRIGRVLLDVAHRPSLLPELIRLGRRTKHALRTASLTLAALLDAEAVTIDQS